MQGKIKDIAEIEKAWESYREFMRNKYGEDFKWTCPHLQKIDKIVMGEEAIHGLLQN
jgi:hypothetical protein